VGIALSDQGGRFATPYEVLRVSGVDDALLPVVAIIHREAVRRIIVGLPLNMDDSVGPAARGVIRWAASLSHASGLPVYFIDERLSSFEAEQSFSERRRGGEHITRGQKKQQLDAVAAALILQGFLDGKFQPLAVDLPRAEQRP
jgi:putative Holliday junction resolvase